LVPLLTSAQSIEGTIDPRRPQDHFRRSVGRREEHILRFVPVDASALPCEAPAAQRPEEPQFVLLDRTADAPVIVEQLLCLRRRVQASGSERVVEVVALQAIVGESAANRRFEGVAAFPSARAATALVLGDGAWGIP